MEFTIREMGFSDRAIWVEMRSALWPEETRQGHGDGIDVVLASDGTWGFVAETIDGVSVGFAEVAVRKYANGCETQPVPFLEGVWVNASFRRKGIATQLINHVEAFLLARGFCEIGSDTQLDNRVSQAAHVGWGFHETERVVYFRKALKA